MADLNEWVNCLVENNNLEDRSELTVEMIKTEIEETECEIQNEEMWCDGSIDTVSFLNHKQNIAALRCYIEYLREMMMKNGNLVALSLCIGIYSDPDELPVQAVFLLPAGTNEAELSDKIALARDSVDQQHYLDIREHFEDVIQKAVSMFSAGYWYYGELQDTHHKKNLWEFKRMTVKEENAID